MPFTTKYPKLSSTIGTKIISKLNSFCLENTVMYKKNIVRMHVIEHTL